VKTTYVDRGQAACGYCFVGFSDANPPHEVTRRCEEPTGTYDYREQHPWHADCIAQANEYERAVKP
jgi:hypothetical protein